MVMSAHPAKSMGFQPGMPATLFREICGLAVAAGIRLIGCHGSGHRAGEALAEQDGELGTGLAPHQKPA